MSASSEEHTSENGGEELEEGEVVDLPTCPSPGQNLMYSLWGLGPTPANVSADMQQIKMLVRTSYHGYEIDPQTRQLNLVQTSVKIENQTEFGAQTTTVGELTQEIVSLYLRPNATIYRVRVDGESMKVIQTERLTKVDLCEEAKKRSVMMTEKLKVMHSALSLLSNKQPGQYLLQMNYRDCMGTLLEEDTSGTKLKGGSMFYHLHHSYHRIADCHTGPTSLVPYSPIDAYIITPWHQANARVPATFPPGDEPGPAREKMKIKKLLLRKANIVELIGEENVMKDLKVSVKVSDI